MASFNVLGLHDLPLERIRHRFLHFFTTSPRFHSSVFYQKTAVRLPEIARLRKNFTIPLDLAAIAW